MKKPQFGTAGQPQTTKTSTSGNVVGGGAPGQNVSTRNKPCKPQFGAQGQMNAGGTAGDQTGRGDRRIAADVKGPKTDRGY